MCKSTAIDIVCIDETKLDFSYPNTQFPINGYHFPQFQKDHNKHDCGKIILIRKDITVKSLNEFETI